MREDVEEDEVEEAASSLDIVVVDVVLFLASTSRSAAGAAEGGSVRPSAFFLPLATGAAADVGLEVSADLRERECISATGTAAVSATLLLASATGEVAAEVTEAAAGDVGDTIGRDG